MRSHRPQNCPDRSQPAISGVRLRSTPGVGRPSGRHSDPRVPPKPSASGRAHRRAPAASSTRGLLHGKTVTASAVHNLPAPPRVPRSQRRTARGSHSEHWSYLRQRDQAVPHALSCMPANPERSGGPRSAAPKEGDVAPDVSATARPVRPGWIRRGSTFVETAPNDTRR